MSVLTNAQILEMARCGLVEFGSHSVHHYALPKLPMEAKRRELRESKRMIEELVGRPCRAFCIPVGLYDAETLDEAFQAGYECVLTSDRGAVDPGIRAKFRSNGGDDGQGLL